MTRSQFLPVGFWIPKLSIFSLWVPLVGVLFYLLMSRLATDHGRWAGLFYDRLVVG